MLFLFAQTYAIASRNDPLQRQLRRPAPPVWERRIASRAR